MPAARDGGRALPWDVDPAQVLITTGSQQGLDLVAKVLIDAGSRVLVETPTYLGALQAFAPMEPEIVSVASDERRRGRGRPAAPKWRPGAPASCTCCPTSRTPPAAP
jgi:aspartate/methionine/tyrosine aminotransferase